MTGLLVYCTLPLGTRRAIFAAEVLRIVSTKSLHESSSFLRQELGQPNITVLGFIPPSPAPWILEKILIFDNFEQKRQ